MPYSGLSDFIACLEEAGELSRIKVFVDPVLEITEVTDRVTKSGGKALIFENTGTGFPLLINAFGSGKRMAMAIGRQDLNEAGNEIAGLFNELTEPKNNFFKKVRSLPGLFRISGCFPSRSRGKGICQEVIHREPDLNMLPVLKCWPHDGGRFITLPVVHTFHPLTGRTNAGTYRMQILNRNTTAMHWQRHKTGANHFEEWKKIGKRMPVSVTLGGDPVYTYVATAPLPENFDEYILAGFFRRKKVKLVRCITNDIFVPSDADIVIEGYVDPSEELIREGPFGDHTGFYSLADWYPAFHVTCITHREEAVYPTTIVGVPPQEDAWLTKATEKIFLAPLRFTLQPEVTDFHIPDAGVAHNLVIVKINKTYPGQGKKVISSLFGAGQMMFTKYLVVVSGALDIRSYRDLLIYIFENTDFESDLLFTSGPLDVLDHASDVCSLGGKLGIDASVKLKEEISVSHLAEAFDKNVVLNYLKKFPETIRSINFLSGFPVMAVGVKQADDPLAVEKAMEIFFTPVTRNILRLVLIVDGAVDVNDWFTVAWQVLGNTDPERDLIFLSENSVFVNGTIKAFRKGGFPRKWPNVVASTDDIIKNTNIKWESLGIGPFIPSPSLKTSKLVRKGDAEVSTLTG